MLSVCVDKLSVCVDEPAPCVDEPAPCVDEPAVGGVSVARAGATLSVRASVPASVLPMLMMGSAP